MGIFIEHSTSNKSVQGGKAIRGPPVIGFKLTDNGDYNVQKKKKKLFHFNEGVNNQDAVNKHQLNSTIDITRNAVESDYDAKLLNKVDYKAKNHIDMTCNNNMISNLNMNNNKTIDIANPRSKQNDAELQFFQR